MWRSEISIQGSGNIATDADAPNTTEPATTRLVGKVAGPERRLGQGSIAIIFVKEGTTIKLRPWIWDPNLETWLLFDSDYDVIPAAPLVSPGTNGWSFPVGARVFFQVISNTGVKNLGIGWT